MTCDGPTCLNNSGGIGFGAMYSTLFFLTLRVGRNKLRPYFLPPLVAAACPGLGRLAPYLERPWRLFETPSLSSVPLTM